MPGRCRNGEQRRDRQAVICMRTFAGSRRSCQRLGRQKASICSHRQVPSFGCALGSTRAAARASHSARICKRLFTDAGHMRTKLGFMRRSPISRRGPRFGSWILPRWWCCAGGCWTCGGSVTASPRRRSMVVTLGRDMLCLFGVV